MGFHWRLSERLCQMRMHRVFRVLATCAVEFGARQHPHDGGTGQQEFLGFRVGIRCQGVPRCHSGILSSAPHECILKDPPERTQYLADYQHSQDLKRVQILTLLVIAVTSILALLMAKRIV